MDEIECEGNEDTLQQCRHTTLHDCLLSEAASVVCLPNTGKSENIDFGSSVLFLSKYQNIACTSKLAIFPISYVPKSFFVNKDSW